MTIAMMWKTVSNLLRQRWKMLIVDDSHHDIDHDNLTISGIRHCRCNPCVVIDGKMSSALFESHLT